MRLYAPESYRRATALDRARYCNGCGGAATGWLTWLVAWLIPDTIWGLDVTEACNIHDWQYSHGKGKARADLMLLCNLLILCSAGLKRLFPLRALRCLAFYLAVTAFGRRFYGRKIADKVRRRGRGRE